MIELLDEEKIPYTIRQHLVINKRIYQRFGYKPKKKTYISAIFKREVDIVFIEHENEIMLETFGKPTITVNCNEPGSLEFIIDHIKNG